MAACLLLLPALARAADSPYQVWVSNERSGDVTIIDGPTRQPLATIPVGKRPRGIHPAPDGARVYVALSGSPISTPPSATSGRAGARGAPPPADDDDADKPADRSADGIGVIDVAARKFLKRLNAGADPEQFAITPDGKAIFASNEDVATASMLDLSSEKVTHIVAVKKEPEGVAITPDGSHVYVTCEATGDVFVIDAHTGKKTGQFAVEGRPRNVAFSSDGKRAYLPSETTGVVHAIDTATLKGLGDITLPEGARPMGILLGPDEKHLWVSTGRGGTVCVIDPETSRVTDAIKVGTRPWGIAFAPDGKTLFVANGPSNDVSVVEVDSKKQIARIKAGEGPWGLTIVTPPAHSPTE